MSEIVINGYRVLPIMLYFSMILSQTNTKNKNIFLGTQCFKTCQCFVWTRQIILIVLAHIIQLKKKTTRRNNNIRRAMLVKSKSCERPTDKNNCYCCIVWLLKIKANNIENAPQSFLHHLSMQGIALYAKIWELQIAAVGLKADKWVLAETL